MIKNDKHAMNLPWVTKNPAAVSLLTFLSKLGIDVQL